MLAPGQAFTGVPVGAIVMSIPRRAGACRGLPLSPFCVAGGHPPALSAGEGGAGPYTAPTLVSVGPPARPGGGGGPGPGSGICVSAYPLCVVPSLACITLLASQPEAGVSMPHFVWHQSTNPIASVFILHFVSICLGWVVLVGESKTDPAFLDLSL